MTIIVDEITIGSAITPFLTDVVDRAQAAHPIPGDVDPAFVRSLTDRLWEEATHIWFRILLEEFHSFRERQGLPRNPEGANALALFSAHLHRSDHRAVLVERWPVAMDLLEQRAGMLREAVCEVARSWEQDRDRLVAEGIVGADFLPIRVVLGEGDSHYGGRTVTLLTDDAGHHVIHKPRSAAPDDLLARLLHTFGQLVGEDLTACAPRTVAGNSGAWQQFVSTVDPATPEEATSYFRRFGMLCALMAAIGAGDLHHENVLVCGPTPCIIDTETLLQPGVVPHDGLLESEVLHAGEHAPGSTLMLPVRVRTGAFDVFVCALGIPWTRQSHKETFELVDDGSDAVRMERANVRITHHANVAHLYGEPLNPLDYLDAIVEGYLTTHRVVRDHTRAMMDVLSSAAETRFRVVLRPTEVYAKFIDASVQASALASESERAQLLNLVRDLDHYDEGQVGRAERADLTMLDVPAFHVAGGERRLRHSGTPVSGDYFTAAPQESAAQVLAAFSGRSPAFHRLMVETSLNELVAAEKRCYPRPMLAELLDPDPGVTATNLMQVFQETAIFGRTRKGEVAAAWLSHLGHDGLETLEPDRAVSLHDQGGLATALLAHAGADRLARAAHRGRCLRVPASRPDISPSVFGGPMSDLLALGEAEPAMLWQAVEQQLASPKQLDLMGGLSGLMLAAAASPSTDPAWLEQARHHLRHEVASINWPRPRTDLAHGALGAHWALLRTDHVLGEPTEESVQAVVADLTGFVGDPAPAMAWCAGTAGGLTVATDAHRIGIDLDPALIDLLVTKTRRIPDGPVDVSLCHGISGQIQTLLRAGRAGLVPDGVQFAHDLWYRAIGDLRTAGLQTGVPGRTTVLGLFLGWAGVYDTACRLAGSQPHFDPLALIPAHPKEI